MDKTSQLLTVAEVAEWLRVEPRYVYRLASSGELIRVYIGRYVRIPPSRLRRTSTHTPSRRSSLRLVVVALVLVPVAISGWCTMPNSKGRRRRFGAIRRLPSGRYQARYPGPDGTVRPPTTPSRPRRKPRSG
jgi:excisionase family DNA binding protein